jgi:hypothetical protein
LTRNQGWGYDVVVTPFLLTNFTPAYRKIRRGFFIFYLLGINKMGEHKFPDRNRMIVPEKPKHPLGWSCASCFHVVKDPTPGSVAMKCTRYPPNTQALIGPQGQFQGTIGLSPPVTPNDWCGEFDVAPKLDA